MKQFLTVLKFELRHYFKNKVYLISSIILLVIVGVGLSLPTIIGGFGEDTSDTTDENVVEEVVSYGYVDNQDIIDAENFQVYFPNATWEKANDEEALQKLVQEEQVEVGFVVTSTTSYRQIVNDRSFSMAGYDPVAVSFEAILQQQYQQIQFEALGIDDYSSVTEILNTPIVSEVSILGNDGAQSYWSTYILIFALYMMVLLYGQNVATSIASEKSNRAVEILVTSASSNALIFGKVIAGALASIIQMGGVILFAKIMYTVNSEAWDGMLDMVFMIPVETLLTFSIFGLLGYLLYTFIYGALGAMVQKSEDINSSSMPITIVFLIAFFITFYGMAAGGDGALLKIASYVPFSSFMAMFTRVSMTDVAVIEIIISLAILVATTVAIGLISAKIYRMGTLMYGNKIKLTTILKQMKNDK